MCTVLDAAVLAEPQSSLVNERVVGWCGYSNTAYMMPKVAVVTEDGLISMLTGRWQVPHG